MKPINYTGLVVLSLILAAVLQLVPASGNGLLWKPNFLLLITIAWIFYLPDHFEVGFAASVGLLADMLFHTRLGHYVLIFACCGLLACLLRRWFAYLSTLYRGVLVFLLVVYAECLQKILYAVWDYPFTMGHIPALSLVSLLIWLIVDRLMHKLLLYYR